DRTIGHGIHEDYDLTNFGRSPIAASLEISIDAGFADLFDVRGGLLLRRGSLQSKWDEETRTLVTNYQNDGFQRGIAFHVELPDSEPEFANGGIMFRVDLEPGQSWHTCVLWRPILDGAEPEHPPRACHNLIGTTDRDRAQRAWVAETTRITTGDPEVTATIHQAVDDLAGLRMHRQHPESEETQSDVARPDLWVPAAGVPWFVTLFGRDALTVSFQTLALTSRLALGSLQALGELQADAYDDNRDMQPGKIEHEVRHGELAALHLVPHTPYFGSHESTTLYVLVAALAWRWHGDRAALDSVRSHVERALAWIDKDGDADGDGLQEYQTRSPSGYYNQGWKDSPNSIVGADGESSKLPIALCEHQGLVVAAKRAWAEILADVYGDAAGATRLRGEADRLADAIETLFWWEDEGTYYLGLDGDKRPIRSVASNAGHLLWSRAIDPERATRVAARLLATDMWSGWGIRTLSAEHVAYNPFDYQIGSVWPHDNAIIAAGFHNYGLDAEAAKVGRGLFEAAVRFDSHRLPELFAGLERDEGSFPVQYLGANVPQAWSSAAVVHLVSVFAGLDADASNGVLRLRPALPDWFGDLHLDNLTVGDASVDLHITRCPDGSHAVDVANRRGDLDVILEDPASS
ncbi:MAG TPA: glycogen debranching N-terminal domain-containing protein, partial [Ilumatobacteraceae bacterium]|nr:glycogen debranching N-terminal domain-containing protein [Ilumatobacteraceae bacterium]